MSGRFGSRGALAAVVLLLGVAAAGCMGSDDEPEVEPARTRAEWATRLFRTILRPMNQNLQALNQTNNPQVRVYLVTGNETTIQILTRRMRDLGACSDKLSRVGPPPEDNPALEPIYANIERACPHYERVASLLLDAIPHLSSGDNEKVAEGDKLMRRLREPSRQAARSYARALALVNRQMLLQDVR